MKSSISYPIRVFATGFVVLTLFSIPAFWLRFLCRVSLSVRIPGDLTNVSIEPSGLLAEKIEDDPNLASKSQITVAMNPGRFLLQLGIVDYLESVSPGGSRSNVYLADSQDDWAYFDKDSGQIVYRYNEGARIRNRNELYREIQYYIGPEGVSEIPDGSLGRFFKPVIDRTWLIWKWGDGRLRPLILYDATLKRFFKIDFEKLTVTKGPGISSEDGHEPIQIGFLDKNPFVLDLNWRPPVVKSSLPYKTAHAKEYEPIMQVDFYGDRCSYLLVLDKSGAINLLDKATLELAGTAGRLPETKSLFGPEGLTTPPDVLSYDTKPVFVGPVQFLDTSEAASAPTAGNGLLRYAGMIVAAVSRDGTDLAVSAFDQKGQEEAWPHKDSRRRRNAVEEAYFGSPGSPASTIGLYLVENLHPPLLSLASYFTASTFTAESGYSALFLLPNSFIAMRARDSHENAVIRLLAALPLIFPSILLAVWLAIQVVKNAAVVGLSRKARLWWAVGTIAFGLPAYITYKLIKPNVTLVTCPNCGQPRRPDMAKCHQCKSPWHVPELTPPAWRVLDGDAAEEDQETGQDQPASA
ncbi:MAG: hypothetical protein P8Z79_18030 [Sedimentisphaerales bacterium]